MESSILLTIPTELRLAIFEHLLHDTSSTLAIGGCYSACFSETSVPLAVFVDGGNIITSTSTAQAARPTQPAISLVSRQLRKETLPIFYRVNHFLLALQNRRARTDVVKWLDQIHLNPGIAPNLWQIAIKHRFGILDYRGTIDFDLKDFRILGPHLWFNSIPPIYTKEVEQIIDQACQEKALISTENCGDLTVKTLRRLIAVLGVVLD